MTEQPKRIVLCLDGTWNNPYQMAERDDGTEVLKPSNPLKMARSVLPWDPDSGRPQLTYYDTGVGALGKYPGLSNRIVGFVDSKLGGGWGAGFEANVEQAVTFLANNHIEGDQVFVFGFSRGAAQARGLTRFLDWMGGIPAKGDAYFVPLYYRAFLDTWGRGDPSKVTTASGKGPEDPMVPIRIELLGVWDTVMALGSRFLAKQGTSVTERSFHVGEKPADCVNHARQALAIDEKRYDFRPEIWSDHRPDQTLEQRWFAGVHSNIGGGYVQDGLANIPFRWMLGEAEKLGLASDSQFTKHYRPYPQARLYSSHTAMYRVLEFVRLQRGRGVRKLTGHPERANLVLDKSVIHRIRSDPKDHEQLNLYRPANVIELLESKKSDLPVYFTSLGLDPEDPILPGDVLGAL